VFFHLLLYPSLGFYVRVVYENIVEKGKGVVVGFNYT
jgi:hypothetical protein